MPYGQSFTYWFLGFEGRNVYVNIWVNESKERNTEKKCTGPFHGMYWQTRAYYILHFSASDSNFALADSKTSQNAIEILKNQDGEIRIPCSDEDNQTTPIPNNPEEITLLQTTVSDSTITENKGSTWSDLISLCTILPLLLLLFQ
ncbi:unnamed protein product [Fasciola hepatica]|uniref:Uncharacterized protein n=1 Tax=Fasciola hepatica TaxID=6192 RepID=A0ABC9HGR0_FASHE